MRAKYIISEIATHPYPYEMGMDNAQFYDSEGNSYYVRFDDFSEGVWSVAFQSGLFNPIDSLTNRHDAFRVFATVISIIKKWAESAKPKVLLFGAERSSRARASLYTRLAKSFTSNSNYVYIDNPDAIGSLELQYKVKLLMASVPQEKYKTFIVVHKNFVKSNSLTEEITDLKISNHVVDSFRGGYRGTLIARTSERQIGYLEYSIYNDVPKIEMIEVIPAFRRSKVARQMLKALQELSPNEEIDWGYTTADGSKLRGSIDFIRRANPEIIKKKQKLAGVKSKLAQMNHKLDQLLATNPELARKYTATVQDRWNALNDLEYRLENELSTDRGEYSNLIPEDELDEGWREKLATVGAAGAIGLGSTGIMNVKQALTQPSVPQQQTTTTAVAPQNKIVNKQILPVTKQQPPKPVVKVEPEVKLITKNPLEKFLMDAAKQSGIKGTELAQFMAQCAHESYDFTRLVEVGNKRYFARYEPKYAPQKAKILGNIKKGDGIRYKGRGFIQLTGRYNYKKAGEALGLDLEKNPQLLEDPKIAAQVSIWYWKNRVKPKVSDFNNTKEITRQINPALRGLEDRHDNFEEYIISMNEPSYNNTAIDEASVAQRERERTEKRQQELQKAKLAALDKQRKEEEIEAYRRQIRQAMINQKLKKPEPIQPVQQPVYTWGGVEIKQDEPEKEDRGFYLLFASTNEGKVVAYWIKDVDYDYQIHDGSQGLESAKKLRRATTLNGDTNTLFAEIRNVIRELRKNGAVHVLTKGLRSANKLLANLLVDYIDAYGDEQLGVE